MIQERGFPMKRILAVVLAAALLCGIIMLNGCSEEEIQPPPAGAIDITDKFTDPSFKSIVYQYINKEAPNPIYDTDVAKITEIYAAMGAKNLDGLEYFTNLEILVIGGNDRTSLPKLPESLKQLNCVGNPLTSLSGLEELGCHSIDLAELPALPSSLKKLDC